MEAVITFANYIGSLSFAIPFCISKETKNDVNLEEIVDLGKNDVTQKPGEGQIRRDEVQWTAMSISFKQIYQKYTTLQSSCQTTMPPRIFM